LERASSAALEFVDLAIRAKHRSKAIHHTNRDSLDAKILALAELPVSELRKAWKTEIASDAPPVRSRAVLCQLLTWQLQSDAIGDLDSATERALTKIGDALRQDGSYEPKIRSGFSPGVIFSREWKGVVHRVTVAVEGFDYRGKKYRSLSDIARTITGTRWSGPRFFGLEQRQQSASRRPAP
jgi:hypothetical protein